MGILPRVKKFNSDDRYTYFKSDLRVYFDGCKELSFALKELLPFINFTKAYDRSDASLILKKDVTINNREEYLIKVTNNLIECRFGDFLGGRNAIATLAQMIENENGDLKIRSCEIHDYPDAHFRSFMHDTGRKYIPISELRAHILLMAKCKFNYLHLHLSEAVGFSIALEKFPELHGVSSEQYTEEEIVELVDYAENLGIEIVPEIDVPGHSNVFCDAWSDVSCDLTDGEKTHGWALCVGAEETYNRLSALIPEVLKLFKSKYFHLGTDEISMRDEMRIPHPHADWLRCKRCRALMKRSGYKTEVELFYHFLNRIYNVVKACGKDLIIWNDWVDISKVPNIPKDIIIEFWRVAAPMRGPHAGCSMQRFLDEGFNVINANFPDTYIDLYVDYGKLKDWDLKCTPASDVNTPGKILGADVCAWDVHSHYAHSIPVSIALFAEKLWTHGGDIGNEYLTDASRVIIGTSEFSIYDYTEKVIVLRDGVSPFSKNINREELAIKLGNIEPRDIAEEYAISSYLSYLK